MHRAAGLRAVHRRAPRLALIEPLRGNCLVDQLRALCEDPARAQRVVPDFGIAHVAVRGLADGHAMRAQLGIQRLGKQRIERGRIGQEDAVRFVAFADADAVHDDKEQWAVESGVILKRMQRVSHVRLSFCGWMYCQ